MKILLSTPPWKTTEMWPPLGLLYIAGNIKKERGDTVKVVDAFCRNMTKEDLVREVISESPDVVGINCSTHTFLATMDALTDIRAALPEAKIVLGGYHSTFAAREILRDYPIVDYVIKGEAEHAFVKLLEHIENGTEPADVEGISYQRGETYVENPLTLIADLDSLTFPDRSMLGDFDYGYYFQGIPLTFEKFTTISTSRGCPFSCSYCSCAAFSLRKWRYRSAVNVVDEIEQIYDQGYRECVLIDDNFTHKVSRVEEICDLIHKRKIDMSFYCEGRANHASLPLLKKMKAAGFDVIYFGAESSSPQVLDFYNKNITPDKTAEAVHNAKKAGMLVITSYIIGAPVETIEDMKETIRFAQSLRPHGVQYNILDYLLGTPMWQEMKAQGTLKENDWKTNHRVYEYYPERCSKEELEALVNEGYGTFMDSWKSASGVAELIRTLTVNKTARKIILGNLTNANARKAVMDGLKGF